MLRPQPFTKLDWEIYKNSKSNVPYITYLHMDSLHIDLVLDDAETYLYFYKCGDERKIENALNCFTIAEHGFFIVDCLKQIQTWQQFTEALLTRITVVKTWGLATINYSVLYHLCAFILNESRK